MISASQVNVATDCLRRYGIEKLDGVRGPQHRSAAAGEAIHKLFEDWLQYGKPPDMEQTITIDGTVYHPGRTAMNALHNLPPPGPHIVVESSFHLGHWTGRIDFAWVSVNGIYVPREQWLAMKDSVEVIPGNGDHKTTGSKTFEYALDEETLRSDTQATLYAHAVLQDFPRAKEADRLWSYACTMKPFPSKKVHLRVHRDEIDYRMEPLNKLAEQLLRLRSSGLKGNDLPANTTSCNKYGGCPHRGGACKLSNEEVIRGFMTNGQTQMSTEQMIQMATQQAAGAMATTVPAPVLPPPPVGEWITHTENPAYEFHSVTREVRPKGVLAPPSSPTLPVAPPMPVFAAPPTPTPALPPPPVQTSVAALPPIVAVAPPIPQVAPTPVTPIGPDGLPFGSINPPESVGIPQRTQPVVAASTADDLDGMDKKQLVDLAGRMGVDVKRLQEKGIREKLRAIRASGGGAIVPPSPVVGTMPSGTPVTSVPAEDVFETSEKDRVYGIVMAIVEHTGAGWDIKQGVAWARALVAEIESGS